MKIKLLWVSLPYFPDGLSLDGYPKLRHTLSQLPPAREFFFHSSQILKGQAPDSGTLYRTGEATNTHQYFIRHSPGQKDQLVMAVFVLDPYESLLDGSHPKFLSYIEDPDSQQKEGTGGTGQLRFREGIFRTSAICQRGDCTICLMRRKTARYGFGRLPKGYSIWITRYETISGSPPSSWISLAKFGTATEAKTTLQQALTIQPHSAIILNSYGSVLAQLGDVPKAIETFEHALALQPDYAHARFNLAEAYESHNPKRAIQEYETFLILAEDKPEESTKVGLAKGKIKALQGGAPR